MWNGGWIGEALAAEKTSQGKAAGTPGKRNRLKQQDPKTRTNKAAGEVLERLQYETRTKPPKAQKKMYTVTFAKCG